MRCFANALLVLSSFAFRQVACGQTVDVQTRPTDELIEKIRSFSKKTETALSNQGKETNAVGFCRVFDGRFAEWEKHYDGSFLSSSMIMTRDANESFWILVNAGPCILSNLAPLTPSGRFSAAGYLWLKVTKTRAVEDENPWFDEPLDYLWKAGTACADKRVSFLLSEWRTAIRENRAEDANHAKLALIAQGIFAYHALFREIELGREDAWIILENTDMPYPGMRRMNHEEWVVWWRDHQSEYTFKLQDPKTDQSPHLEKWHRLGR